MIQAGKGIGRVWESEEVNYQTLNLESKALALTSNCTSSVSYSTPLGLSFLNCQMCVHMGGEGGAWLAVSGPFPLLGLYKLICLWTGWPIFVSIEAA